MQNQRRGKMGLFKNVKAKFADFWSRPQVHDFSKQRIITKPVRRNIGGGLAANARLLRGI
jgi:hypothetical protein